MPHCVHQRTCPIVQNENHWRARPSAAASYKTDDDDIKRRNDTSGVGGGKITSPPPLNPHLQSGQDKRGIGCPRPDKPPSKAKGPTTSNPLRRSASVGDWQRKYLFLEDPEARLDGNREGGGARDSFVEQEPVTGRTFDPLAFREEVIF